MTRIIHATTQAQYQSVRELFIQYADSLGFDLEFQDFSRELAELPGDYKSPAGCMLLAEAADGYAGCVALRPLQDQICEMKRLFVIPEYQGCGIGRTLARAVIAEARKQGYQKMRLDTVESMKAAQGLYCSLGFKTIEAYCHNPLENPSFMELEL
ncbi:MAG: GNAT family N-acetyltransferase [Desulfobacteraceae bacterium]|jgi:ribosomal protein S18 acetylase RimI-like enzyme|nr:GNAT family N-acetyltransferase [Desulfobacteraceae bacterium]